MTTTETTSVLPAVSRPLVAALEDAWEAIQANHPDVPAVVVTLGAGSIERRGLKLGHFAAARWQVEGEETTRAELFIGGEGLAAGAEDLLATLLHEAAHGVANTRGIQDTSRQGRYHNKRFAAIAGELGLTVTKDDEMGWSPSSLAEGTAAVYADVLAELARVLIAYRHAEPERVGTKKDTNTVKAAVCSCPRRIRVAASVLELAPILCGECGDEFAFPPEDEDE